MPRMLEQQDKPRVAEEKREQGRTVQDEILEVTGWACIDWYPLIGRDF